MTNDEFAAFCRWSITRHTEELTEQHRITQEEAIKETIDEIAGMFPDGLNTEHNYLMTIEETDSSEIIGFIWTLHEETAGRKQSFLCDFVICEPKRRKGYATAALGLTEKNAADAGCQESVLFVADGNNAATALYQKCGYQYLRQASHGKYMIKQLS